MAAKKDYATICDAIIDACGGEHNISRVSHCMTRLRAELVDPGKFNDEAARIIVGVLNVVIQNGEYQFVIGQDVAQLYEEFAKHGGIKAGGAVEDEAAAAADANIGRGNIVDAILSFIGGTFSPAIPVLVAGGLTGAVLTLLTTFCGVSPESGAYKIFFFLNQATFYFLPVFIGFSAAQRLKSNGFLGAFLGAVLLYFTANMGETPIDFFGIPVQAVAYNSTVFPVILGVLFMSIVYRFLQKHMPVYTRTIFVPLITMLVSVPVTLIVLGPIGNTMGVVLSDAVLATYRMAPALAVGIVGMVSPWLVFFGMNNATYPVVFALMAEVGSDPLVCTGMAPANVAVGGACLAAMLIAKSVDEKSIAAGAGITALCGITEPGVYGVLFTKRYPLVGAMIGGGIGGLVAGLLGMTQYVISTPGFISFAAYISPEGGMTNLWISLGVMVLATVIGFLATYVLGKRAASKGRVEA